MQCTNFTLISPSNPVVPPAKSHPGSDASANGAGFVARANSGDVILNVANSSAGNNATTGIQAGGGSALSIVRLAGVSILSNAVDGMVVGTNGSIVSFGNNYNSGTGAPTATIAPQ
jgi:hypothetical protein